MLKICDGLVFLVVVAVVGFALIFDVKLGVHGSLSVISGAVYLFTRTFQIKEV